MSVALRPSILQTPQQVHPLLWRASQLAHPYENTQPSGHPHLDAHLPGHGWPVGAVIELLSSHPGIGELQLLKPVLQTLDGQRSLILLNPPYPPSSLCLQQWFTSTTPVWSVHTPDAKDTLWTAEKILQHDACALLLCWANDIRPMALRRLQWAARQSNVLFFLFRHAHAKYIASIAPLRILLQPAPAGIRLSLLKRRGPSLAHKLFIPLANRLVVYETMDKHLLSALPGQ